MAELATNNGSLELQIDESGLEATLVFSPEANGPQWDRQKVNALLEERGLREGIENQALDVLFDPEKGGSKRVIIVARGREPQGGRAPELTVEKLPIPEALQSYENRAILADESPRVYFRMIEKTKTEKVVTKKPKLPFLPAKEQKQVVWTKKETITPLNRPGEEQGRGYAHKGDIVAKVTPGSPARPGRDVFGKEIPAAVSASAEAEPAGPFLGEGLKQTGSEIRAEVGGFFRYGSNWIELFPFSLHEHRVYASENKLTCFFDFIPGSDPAAPPTAEQILEEAQGLGFPKHELLEVDRLAELLSRALTDKVAIKAEPVNLSADADIQVVVSQDKLCAHLSLRKGRGRGRPLSLKEVGQAIRSRELKGLDIPRVQEDILAFHEGGESRLENYLLVEGREAERGEDGRIEWRISFLADKRVTALKEQAGSRREQLEEFASLATFPMESVQTMAEVQEKATIAEVIPATAGTAGVDVFGTVRPGIKGQEVQVELFENLKQVGREIIANQGGLLDTAEEGERLLLRVRPHQDREIQVSLTEDRMQAHLTLLPAKGTGEPLDPEVVGRVIGEAGVEKGLQAEQVAQAIEKAKGGKPVQNILIAQGQEPQPGRDTELEIKVQLASGQRLTVREDGRADYRSQDKITVVKAGNLLARLSPPTAGIDGWDVTGKTIPARRGSARYVHVGKNVERREEEDGSLQYFAKIDGELDYRGSSLDVLRVHTVEGDVSLESGNVNFSGTIRVAGSVQSGFSVVSTESIFVEESVHGALLSAGDSIHIEKGIVGEKKAVLRAKKSIRARFAEQATLLAVEDIQLANACLRCTVKCNGRMNLESEKGNIVGGRVYCKLGLSAMNVGSGREIATEIHFGQDILIQDQLEREQRHSERLKKRNVEIERSITNLKRTSPGDRKALEQLHAEKRRNLQQLEMQSKRIFILAERLEQHFPAEIAVRGVIYPGVVLKSHGRQREVKTAVREVVFFFNTATGRIEEKPLNE
jgi:uncharacterized protein (DUF342 family)